MNLFRTLVIVLLSFESICWSADLLVPAEYSTIQAAIEAANQNGDRVLVSPGIYQSENQPPINLLGKSVILESIAGRLVTVLDGIQLRVTSGEPLNCEIIGFTFRNTIAPVEIIGSSLKIRDCKISNNTSVVLNTIDAHVILADCDFVSNDAGQVIRCSRSLTEIQDCTFTSNKSNAAMIDVFDSTLILDNTHITNNECPGSSAMSVENSSLSADQLLLSDNFTSFLTTNSEQVLKGGGLRYYNATSATPFGSDTAPYLNLSACTISNNIIFGIFEPGSFGSPDCSCCSPQSILGVGAHVYSDGGEYVTINSCNFVANELSGAFVTNERQLRALGGGLYIAGSVPPRITNCRFDSNKLKMGAVRTTGTGCGYPLCAPGSVFQAGGGIYLDCRFLDFSNNEISRNYVKADKGPSTTCTERVFECDTTNGGGMYVSSASTGFFPIEGCQFTSNLPSGLYLQPNASLVISNSLFANHIAETSCDIQDDLLFGIGDFAAIECRSGPLITNCFFSNNREGVRSENSNSAFWPTIVGSFFCGHPEGDITSDHSGIGWIDAGKNAFAESCGDDCNLNDVPDLFDLQSGFSEDCNSTGIPDECELDSGEASDCNGNLIPDFCDIQSQSSPDCDRNGIPDECQIDDCNSNGIPDSCDLLEGGFEDCDGNGVIDSCDLESGTLDDCDENGVPDICGVDCNENGLADSCDVEGGFSQDCDGNGFPDECQTDDCNTNGQPDSCDINDGSSSDCNSNGIPDECENINDCNKNGVNDACDIAEGSSQDTNSNGVPDECEAICPADINDDGFVNLNDLILLLSAWGTDSPESDIDQSGDVGLSDLIAILASWGAC